MVSHESVSTVALEMYADLMGVAVKALNLQDSKGGGDRSPTLHFMGLWCERQDWGSEWAFLTPLTGHQASIMQFLNGGDQKRKWGIVTCSLPKNFPEMGP